MQMEVDIADDLFAAIEERCARTGIGFEHMVDLLLRAGFDSREERGRTVPRTGSGAL